MSDNAGSKSYSHSHGHRRSRTPEAHHRRSDRSRSPRVRHKRKRSTTHVALPEILPMNARALTKRDYSLFRPMFALYLDIQKGRILEDLEEAEIKGRWKSFLGKWNRGELAEGWYDPMTLQKAIDSLPQEQEARQANSSRTDNYAAENDDNETAAGRDRQYADDESDSDASVGPAPPGEERRAGGRGHGRVGPRIPTTSDLELKREADAEDAESRRDDLRADRRADRKSQREALDELAPRAEAGTRERRLEKKKEVNEKMRSFRDRLSPGAAEVPDAELMGGGGGGGGDSVEGYRRQKREFERKKNERELRKEEMLRARAAEREERLSEYREKEDATMDMLRNLARQRFG